MRHLERGRLFLHIGVTDIGTATKTAMAQLAAEAMGMDLANVLIVGGLVTLTRLRLAADHPVTRPTREGAT